MIATFKLENPGAAQCTMTITLTLDSWIKLRKQLNEIEHNWQYPASVLREQIADLTSQAQKEFTPKPPEPTH